MNKTITKNKKGANQIQNKGNNRNISEKGFFEPSENVIQTILNYSKALSIRKFRNDVYFEMLLN